MMAMLVLVTALGERLFRNAAVGRIGAALFFFHGALSFIPYVAGLGSIDRIINDVPNLSAFLSSGFPTAARSGGSGPRSCSSTSAIWRVRSGSS